MTVPVHIIAGFLGAGKTTALSHVLGRLRAEEQVAVVVNDFGEAAVDQEVLSAQQVAMLEIQGACICCTAPEGFVASVGELLEQQVDRIFIEPTGLARPADLIDTLRRAPYASQLDLRPLVVLVDPAALAQPSALLREQAEAADVLVCSKADLATPEQLAAFETFTAELWPGPADTVRIVDGQLPLTVLEPLETKRAAATGNHHHNDHHHHAHHDAEWASFSAVWSAEAVFVMDRLAELLGSLLASQRLTRLKGLFRTDAGTVQLQIASGRVHERASGFRRDSRVDVIVAAQDRALLEGLEERFAAALQTEAEAPRLGERLEWVLGDERFESTRETLAAIPGQIDIATVFPKYRGQAAPVSEVLRTRGVALEGREVRVVAGDGFVSPAVPAEVLASAWLLHSLDDGPLPPNKGGPLRLLIPKDAGPAGPCSNVKGIVQLVLV